jgi:glycerol-3-phosphate O-acyltransferase / dihydroxyacetone phosphate acyltransferase
VSLEVRLLSRIITSFVGWAVSVFYEVERTGPAMPDGPVLVTGNHPNALVDPLVIFRTGARPSRPLAKAPLFEQALVGAMLRGLGGLPVYRREDGLGNMHLNDTTFDAAIQALHDGEAVQIYPEGQSHSGPALTPIRTGAARIALLAEQRCEWELGLWIQPVGLTYTRKHLFRGRVVAMFGEAFSISGYRAAYEEDERGTVRALTDRIRVGLESVTLNFDHPEDRELVEVAERLYAREKKLARWRERESMTDRMPRLRRFAGGIRWLRATDPERFSELRALVRRYLRLLTLFGASEGDIPPTYRMGVVLAYSIRQLLLLALVLPVAVVGMVVWMPPFVATRYIAPRFRPEIDQVATYKIAIGLLAFPLWWFLVSGGAWLLGGATVAGILAVAMPVVGFAAITWRDRQSQVREDTRVFLRAVRNRRGRDRLSELRTELVGEFDALAEEWDRDRAEVASG